MSINHHLSDALLMAYSAGTLPEAFNLVIATHVSLCDECRARVESFDAVGGAVLDSCGTAEIGDDALEATMAMIGAARDRGKDPIVAGRPVPRGRGVFPAPLQDYIGGDLDAVHWRPAGGGVKHAVLETSKDATVRLIRIPPGATVPDHGHRGMEMTLVLKGAFRDDAARFARGDIEVVNEDVEHTPVAEDGEVCVCLAATDAPLRFNALLPKLAQPFLRF